MKRMSILLLILPGLLFSAEHSVPIGSSGNRLLLTIENDWPLPLQSVRVKVAAAPNWIEFNQIQIELDSIPSQKACDAEFVFSVQNGETGRKGSIRIEVRDILGHVIGTRTIDLITELSVKETRLFAPFPNPANPNTTIQFALVEESKVRLDVYNVLGQRVRTLLNEIRSAGQWQIVWDGKSDEGVAVSSGMYVVQIIIDSEGSTDSNTKKISIEK